MFTRYFPLGPFPSWINTSSWNFLFDYSYLLDALPHPQRVSISISNAYPILHSFFITWRQEWCVYLSLSTREDLLIPIKGIYPSSLLTRDLLPITTPFKVWWRSWYYYQLLVGLLLSAPWHELQLLHHLPSMKHSVEPIVTFFVIIWLFFIQLPHPSHHSFVFYPILVEIL